MSSRPPPVMNGVGNSTNQAYLEEQQYQIHKRQEAQLSRDAEYAFLRSSLRESEKLRALQRAERAASPGSITSNSAANRRNRSSGKAAARGGGGVDKIPTTTGGGGKLNEAFVEDYPVGPSRSDPINDINLLFRDIGANEEEQIFFHRFLNSQKFSKTLLLHRHMERVLSQCDATASPTTMQSLQPITKDSSSLCVSTAKYLHSIYSRGDRPRGGGAGGSGGYNHQLTELINIITKPEIVNLLSVHDDLALSWWPKWTQKQLNLRSRLPPPQYPSATSPPPPTTTDVTITPNKKKRPNAPNQHLTINTDQRPSTSDNKSPLTYDESKNQISYNRSPEGNLLKVVVFEKGYDSLGITVKNDGVNVYVGRIVYGGLAYNTGFVREGDELISINGIDIRGRSVDEISDYMASQTGSMEFIFRPVNNEIADVRSSKSPSMPMNLLWRNAELHLRALFVYNPDKDLFLPCKDIGLEFEKGSIIHVINTSDPHWWQGYLEDSSHGNILSDERLMAGSDARTSSRMTLGEREKLASLLPSPEFQRNRQLMIRNDSHEASVFLEGDDFLLSHDLGEFGPINIGIVPPETSSAAAAKKQQQNENNSSCSCFPCLKGGSKTDDDNHHARNSSSHLDAQVTIDIPTYERVELYYPQPARKRPIVIVGPSQLGRRELLKKLIAKEPQRFATVVPVTTRAPQSGEASRREFKFITQTDFDHMINLNQLVEYGMIDNVGYGITRQSIMEIIQQGKVCILSMASSSLKALRATNLLPYIIFLSPTSSLDKLRNLLKQVNKLSAGQLSDQQLLRVNEAAKIMDTRYGHLYDTVLTHGDLNETLNNILIIADRLETDPQWICRDWLMAMRHAPPPTIGALPA